MTLEQRIARLEALEAIRELKHRYLNACDLKDVTAIRDCFAQGPVLIDYGPLGVFNDREPFLALYRELACVPRVIICTTPPTRRSTTKTQTTPRRAGPCTTRTATLKPA